MPAILGFIGWHNSGKTTLMRAVAALLRNRGYKLAVIKASGEPDLYPDQAGSDTGLYWQDGVEQVALLTPDQFLLRSRPPHPNLHTLAQRFFAEADLVLVEGCKHADIAKIEVHRKKMDPTLYNQVSGVIAVVTEQAEDASVKADELPHFLPHQHEELVNFIEKHFLAPSVLLHSASPIK